MFGKLIFNGIDEFTEPKLSEYLTGFSVNHSTWHIFLSMLENWKILFNKGLNTRVIYMYLSKAFDTINHQLLMAKLWVF